MALKRLSLLAILFLLAFCGWGLAQEAEPRPVRKVLGPDHLTTIPKRDDPQMIAYDAKLKRLLDLDQFAFARMWSGGWAELYMGESALSLHGAAGERDPAKSEKFFLTSKVADQNVWYTMPGSGRLPQEVVVSVSKVPLDKGLALRLIRLWERMLERTAPRDHEKYPYTINDGAAYKFSTVSRSGEYLWMPNDRLSTGIFLDLASTLQSYARGSSRERRSLMAQIERKAAALEKYLDEHPGKQ